MIVPQRAGLAVPLIRSLEEAKQKSLLYQLFSRVGGRTSYAVTLPHQLCGRLLRNSADKFRRLALFLRKFAVG